MKVSNVKKTRLSLLEQHGNSGSRQKMRKDNSLLGEPHALLVRILESILCAIIRIDNFLCSLLPTKLAKKHHLGRTSYSSLDLLEILQVLSVHGKDVIKLGKVRIVNLH